jgi:outer membrane lipoprotein LolB
MAIRNDMEASSFNVFWVQQGDVFQIELSGPLGQGEVLISGQPGDVTLTQGKKEVRALSLSDLAYEITSMDLPLDHIQFWVRALPSPFEQANVINNDAGQVERIEQSGWQVSITDYFDAPSDNPRKLNFAKSSESGKLIIREWNGI